ncbi:LANO_0G02542g1_1 [Lachancea nothofagi CBS 11611]|uniref:LANO_0G02542g1_1 n=1 Tax=Lachancea nothofagi CBS 11611 TaxID=1266666 RepID=A0A1G4KFF5_9SACH|nr:LANO_0G02542g1_1 [Lachancea nothofagi CBS 11611]
MDYDETVNLEEQFYQVGFEEGRRENLEHNLIEGKQYGLQVGFQRFLFLGLVQGVCNSLKALKLSPSIEKNVNLMLELIDEIPMGNENASVEIYERNMVKLKNKFRLLLMVLSKHWKDLAPYSSAKLTYEQLEKITKIVAGELNSYVEDDDGTDSSARTQPDTW